MSDGEKDEGQLKALVQELLQEADVSDRLDDADERLLDLSTEVRLQARRSSVATQLQLPLAGSNPGSAAASPRVAGPVSACATPRSNLAAGTAAESSRTAQQRGTLSVPSSSSGSKHEAGSATNPSSSCSGASKLCSDKKLGASAASASGAVLDSPAAAAANLGMFGMVKHWGEDALDPSNELKKAAQLAAAAAASASEAAAAAAKCQQQVLELRGRQGQAERRLDTLWQLQEAASQTEAAVSRAQQELQQGQQQLQQQQQNMAAVRAQIQQLDCSAASSQLQRLLQELQQQADALSRDAAADHDQLLLTQAGLQSARNELQAEVQQAAQQLAQQLQQQRGELAGCAGAAGSALDKAEQLRQGAVVLAGRLDGVPGQISAAVQPLQERLSAVEASLASWSAAAAKLGSTVQQGQLNAAVAQLSSSWTRQCHELTSQLSCLTSRLEALEGAAARQEQVVLQDEFKRQLAQLHSDIEVAVLHATAPLHKQLKGKADVSQLTSSNSSMEARLSSSEKSLLLGLKSVGDKAALLLQHKADLAAFEDWRQQVGEELCAVRAQLATQQAAMAAAAAVAEQHYREQRQVSSAPVPDGQCSSSCNTGRMQRAAGALELFSALVGGQPGDSAAAGDAAAAAHSAAVEGARGAADAVSCLTAAIEVPSSGMSSAAAAAATAAASGSSSASCSAAATTSTPEHGPASAPAVIPADAAHSTSASTPGGAAAAAAASAAGSGVAATIVRPLTTGKRHVSPARQAHPPGSPAGTITHQAAPVAPAGSKQRPPSMQPWPSSATPAATELHSAAHNAKLAKAARDRELARARLGDSRALVAALVQSSAVPSAEHVADALQQQLNVLGLTSPRLAATAGGGGGCDGSSGSAHVGVDRTQQREAAAAAGGTLSSVLAAARTGAAAAAAGGAAAGGGTVDGSGRLMGSVNAAAGVYLPASSPDRGDAAAALRGQQLGGALSASGVTYSLRLQSAGAQQQHSKAAAAAGVARTSSVGALPACVGSIPLAGSSSSSGGAGGSDAGQVLRQSPTADGLRALLKGNSAHGGSHGHGSSAGGASQQLPAANSRISSGGSRSDSGSKDSGQDAVGASVGRALPLALMKQQSSHGSGSSSSSSRITSA
uniref:Uncharacterized protein n=1 Tax=Tetradesmus obliquus TaxID=3088 RepID=A0A383WNM8_TETOB|eukprot:jgi/Sobl393_1/5268/SZX79068.1